MPERCSNFEESKHPALNLRRIGRVQRRLANMRFAKASRICFSSLGTCMLIGDLLVLFVSAIRSGEYGRRFLAQIQESLLD